jgi:acetyl esterase/lipase
LKLAVWAAGFLVAAGLLAYAALRYSPWPAAMVIRWAFDLGGARTARALEKHVPPGVAAQRDLRYDEADADALLDVYYPASIEGTGKAQLTVVWVHGGGWIAGSKGEVANYTRILAARGYTVVAVDYSLAPAKLYPTPILQVNSALGYLTRNAQRLHIDPERLVLAGDSAGAQIAAQVANLVSVPAYAESTGVKPAIHRRQLVGVILQCGAYEAGREPYDELFSFRKAMVWAYHGGRNFAADPAFAPFSVLRYVTSAFPPAFISAGNADPLLRHSVELAEALGRAGVKVDSLFFPADRKPALPHEYQFNLDTDAGRQALDRTLAFLAAL